MAMLYLHGDAPQLLCFEAKDDAVRCQWLMRAIGFATLDVLPVPTEARSFCLLSRAGPCVQLSLRRAAQTIREMVQRSADGVSVLAVCAGELDLSPAKDLEQLAERLRGLEGVREEYYAQQMLQALRAQQQGRT